MLSHDKASVQHETDSDNPDTDVAESGDRLYLNDDAGRFVEVSGGPLADDYPSEGAAWCDLDGDGLADLVVANYEQEIEQTGGERGVGFAGSSLPESWRQSVRGCFSGFHATFGQAFVRPRRELR